MLRDALIDLIEERGLEGLTVRDLTEKAGLNRGTFYLHYKDIQDLLEHSKEEVFEGLARLLDAMMIPPQGTENWDIRKPHPVAVTAFEYLAENARFFSIMLGANGDPGFCSRWKRVMREQIVTRSLVYIPENADLPIPRDFLIAYIVSAQLGLIQHWFETGMKLPPAEMAALMTQLNYFGPKRIFESGQAEA
jgi:AcrR family transcriptional regulator